MFLTIPIKPQSAYHVILNKNTHFK